MISTPICPQSFTHPNCEGTKKWADDQTIPPFFTVYGLLGMNIEFLFNIEKHERHEFLCPAEIAEIAEIFNKNRENPFDQV